MYIYIHIYTHTSYTKAYVCEAILVVSKQMLYMCAYIYVHIYVIYMIVARFEFVYSDSILYIKMYFCVYIYMRIVTPTFICKIWKTIYTCIHNWTNHAMYSKAMPRRLLRKPLVIFAGVQTSPKSALCLYMYTFIYIYIYILHFYIYTNIYTYI